MKETIKSVILIILAISTIFFYIKWKSCPSVMHETVRLDSIEVPVIKYIASDSTNHVVINNEINKIIATETSQTAAKLEPIIQKLADNLSVSSKQIESSTTVSTSTSEREIALKKKIDSLESNVYVFKDKYLDVTFRPDIEKPTFDFSYNADLNITQYWKKTWFLGSKHSYTDISSNDPRTTIKGVSKFTVVQKQPTLGLRVQGVGGYSINNQAFFAGPSLRFDIKDLSIRGSYFYNTVTKKWTPNIAAEYNIIKF